MCPQDVERKAYWFLAAAMAAVLALIVLAPTSEAAHLGFRYGIEKNAQQYGAGNAERLYGLELQLPLGGGSSYLKADAARWIAKQEGRESAWLAALGWGFRAQMVSGFFVDPSISLAWISATDGFNGSHLQFQHTLRFGWMSRDGWGMSAGWWHLSNGSLFGGANLGRDWGGMAFHFPISYTPPPLYCSQLL